MNNKRVYILNWTFDFYSNKNHLGRFNIGVVISNGKLGNAYKALWLELNKFSRPMVKLLPGFKHISGYFFSVSLAH